MGGPTFGSEGGGASLEGRKTRRVWKESENMGDRKMRASEAHPGLKRRAWGEEGEERH